MEKMVEQITAQEVDFAKWYTDVVTKAGLVAYAPVRGCCYYHPYSTALWENIRAELDRRFRETGHENVMMPLLIPESLFNKEKDHIEGFAPEVPWITHAGNEKLTERYLVRPTSEVLFCDYYAQTIQSWRDLPKLYNQWANVVRWEKATRPFLRTLEFFWQEGHTMHETAAEARAEQKQQLDCYSDFAENFLAIPVIRGQKTKLETFPGAEATFTFETMMRNGYALQSGTVHYFNENFARAFGVKFTARDGKIANPFYTTWGLSTRIIGALIMTHGDNNGLVMPPYAAPIQVVVIPVAQHKPGVLDAAQKLAKTLEKVARIKLDATENSPGWKFAEYEMKGIPLRVEIGPKDIENGSVVVVRRDTFEKAIIKLDNLNEQIPMLLKSVHDNLFKVAYDRRSSMIHTATTLGEIIDISKNKPGFIKAMWCGDDACELELKNAAGITSRCIPFEQERISDKCVCCGKPAKHMVYWGKTY